MLPESSVMSQGAPDRILVVEDPAICSYLCAVLKRQGYLTSHADGDQALAMIRRDGEPDLLITDEPAMFLEFANALSVLYTASCPDLDVAEKFFACQVLIKPFRQADLLGAVKTLCGRRPST